MERGRGRGDRGRGAGAGDLHADEGFLPRLLRLRGEAPPGIRGQLMADVSYLDWPFLDDAHRDFAARLQAWAGTHIGMAVHPHHDVDGECRDLVRKLGEGGWLAR